MNLRRRCIPSLILASLGVIAISPMMPAQVTSGEQNPQFAGATALQKKPFKRRLGFTPTKTIAIS